MRALPLRNLVGTIGLVVAIVTAISIPAGYAVFEYSSEGGHLAEHARLGAGRLAKYIYGHEAMWQYQRVRLAELVDLSDPSDIGLRKQIVDARGATILAVC